jgi:hypothetical protein
VNVAPWSGALCTRIEPPSASTILVADEQDGEWLERALRDADAGVADVRHDRVYAPPRTPDDCAKRAIS